MDGLGTRTLLWCTRLAWIVFLLNTRNGLAITPICSQGQTGRCFQVNNTRMTWVQADQACTSRGGTLGKVGSAADQTTIADFARNNAAFTLWTGGKVTDTDWKWTGLRHLHIRYMGCYGDDVNNPDLEYVINDGRTFNYPSQCSKACIDISSTYQYSSVQFDNNHVICRCGRSYGKYGRKRDQKCEKHCVPQPPTNSLQDKDKEILDRFCGSLGYQIVVRDKGLDFHNWVGPGAQGNHDCAALDNQHSFRWKDYHCNEKKLRHICEYDTQQSSCNTPKMWIANSPNGDGICISKQTSSKNWYDAKLDCEGRGGYLLEIRDQAVQNALVSRLSGSNERYWIGLTRRTWTWRDGSIIDTFYSWEMNQPRPTDKDMPTCLMMGQTSYKWMSANCTTQHPFVCEYTNGLPGANQQPNPQPSPPPSPPPGSNNQPPNNNNPAIIGGAAGGGALVLIIIVVVVCCCCRKKTPPKKTKSKAHSKQPRETRQPRGDKPPAKAASRPLPTAPRKTLVGHDNHAVSLEHTKPSGAAAKANTYVQGRNAPPPEEDYLALYNPAPTKPSVYEALDKGPDVYEDIIDDKSVYVYEDYIDMTQGMTKPDYDNVKQSARKESSYTHYLQPTR